MNFQLLTDCGINYAKGLERFMNDEELYSMVLAAFADETTLDRAREAYASGDMESLLRAVHEAKDSSGNAGLNNVCAASGALTALLRTQPCKRADVADAFVRFETVYQTVQNGIRQAMAE